METSDGKQAERALERPKRSKNEAKKRPSAVWDHDAAGSNPVTPTIQPPVARELFPSQAVFTVSPPFPR